MADENNCQEIIKQIIADCSGIAQNRIEDNSWLDTELYIDSLILTEIVYALENRFQLALSDSDIRGVSQVSDFYHLIERKLMTDK